MSASTTRATLRGRAAGAAGILFFAAIMAAPDPRGGGHGATAEQVKQLYLASQQSWRATFLLAGVAYAFFLWFLAALCSELRTAEGEPQWLSTLAMTAGGLVAAFYVLGTALRTYRPSS